MDKYDFVVIGSGPAGQRAAIQAAKLGRTMLLTEKYFRISRRVCIPAPFPAKLCTKQSYTSVWLAPAGVLRTQLSG